MNWRSTSSEKTDASASSEPQTIWGPDSIPPEGVTGHFMVVGTTGSGKTTLLNMLMNSCLRSIGHGKGCRALVYDAKQDVVSTLCAIGLDPVILHPFDSRCHAWDMSADIDGPVNARQIATILVPERESGSGSGSFFDDATRDLLAGVITSFVRCTPRNHKWTFRDVLLALLYHTDALRPILQRTDQTKRLMAYLEGDARTTANIRASLNTRLGVYEPIAAAWHHATDPVVQNPPRWFSIKDWVKREQTVVLGNDEAGRVALDAVNQVLFRRATEILLAGEEVGRDQISQGRSLTWVFFDEVREAGKLDGLGRLLTKGRSKGVCVVLGFQDIEGLRSVYGDEVANELTGQCNNVAILRLRSPNTAKWASEVFGETERFEEKYGVTFGHDGGTSSVNTERVKREAYLPSEFIYLPRTDARNGLWGVYLNPFHRPARIQLPWSDVAPYLPPEEKIDKALNFEPASVERQYLEPWDVKDWARLGFKGSPPSLTKRGLRDMLHLNHEPEEIV